MVQFKRQIVPRSIEGKRSYGRGNPVDFVVIHQTGNPNVGANAQMHANLQSRLNPRQASWHESVDDKEAIQSFDDSVRCWAATDGKKVNGGNMTGYHIEICINSDGDYNKAVENGAKRAAAKLKQHGLGINRLKQHNDFHPKNCPAQIRAGKNGITWAKFVAMVRGFMDGEVSPAKPEDKPKDTGARAILKVDGWWGVQTTRALQQALGTVADGELWNQSRNPITLKITGGVKFGSGGSPVIRALQKKVGAKVDGYLGVETFRKLQAYLGTPVDGEMWTPSTAVKELQRRLNAGTF